MAAEPGAPWSRWDNVGGVQATTLRSTFTQSYQASNANSNNVYLQRQQFDSPGLSQTQVVNSGTGFFKAGLIETRYNPSDPNFYDCVYAVANSANPVIETCYKEIGCCSGGCCSNSYWHEKYGWAVALIVIFCAFVVIGVAIWLVVWLFNRSRDKQMRRDIATAQSGISPAASQTSLYPRNQTPMYAPYGQNLPAANAGYKY